MVKQVSSDCGCSTWWTTGLLLVVLFSFGGCTSTFGWGDFSVKSHFTYPNSNVIPLGDAKGSVTGDCDDPGVLTQKAITQAIDSKGGDLLINYTTTSITRSTSYPFVPYVSKSCESVVEGTVVKMEIGRQIIK